MKVACAMSSPCAPVVSLNVSTVCQPAAGASVGSADIGIGATVGVGSAVFVGATSVGVSVGTTVEAAPNSVVCCLTGVTPHAASSVLASSKSATSHSKRRDKTRDGDLLPNKRCILPTNCPAFTACSSIHDDRSRLFRTTCHDPIPLPSGSLTDSAARPTIHVQRRGARSPRLWLSPHAYLECSPCWPIGQLPRAVDYAYTFLLE